MPLIKTYKGDTFRNLIRQYSFERMAYDPQYRHAVRKAKAMKKAARAAKVSNEKPNFESVVSDSTGGLAAEQNQTA